MTRLGMCVLSILTLPAQALPQAQTSIFVKAMRDAMACTRE